MRSFSFAVICVLAAGSAIAAPEPGGIAKTTVMLEMSDGVRLATDVYRPRGEGPFPTILWRTPYGRAGHPAPWLAAGYACVKQDMRGRFDSEGENIPFIGCGWTEHRDGFDTIAWIRNQSWCNGKIGTAGGSALGITQNLLAGTRPEGLAAQHIAMAAASLYHDAAYVGGALRKSQVEGWLTRHEFDPLALRLYREHPNYDDWWRRFDSRLKHRSVNAPGMHVGGWFDTFSAGTISSFRGRQLNGASGARGKQVLVMGPWAHGGFRDGGRVGDLTFPGAATPPTYDVRSWFARHLKGDVDAPVAARGRVAYYVMGDVDRADGPGNEWRFASDWPLEYLEVPYYFGAEGSLSPEAPGESAGDRDSTEFDPAKPCPTIGGCNLSLPAGPRDQRPIEGRPDVLVYTTPPLEEPVEATGRAVAWIFISSSAVDTDLSVRLCDVYPNGASYLMAEGMLRLRHRDDQSQPEPLEPGEVYEVQVLLWPTSVVFDRGHRIRVTITHSNFPRFDVNPGTGQPGTGDEEPVVQQNVIYRSPDRPSRIVLPIVGGPDETDDR